MEDNISQKKNASLRTLENINENGNSAILFLALYYIFGILSLIGGAVLSIKLYPGDPGIGMEWSFIAYLPSAQFMGCGILTFLFFITIGHAMVYLKKIVDNTSYLCNDIEKNNKDQHQREG